MTAANLGRHSALPAGVTPAQTPEQIARAWATNPVYTAECRNCGRRHTVRLTCSDYAAGRPQAQPLAELGRGLAAAMCEIGQAMGRVMVALQPLLPALQQTTDVIVGLHNRDPDQFHHVWQLRVPCAWCLPDRPEVDHGGI